MRSFNPETTRKFVSYIAIVAVVSCAIMFVPILLRAHSVANAIRVTNNSSRNIRHIYLAAPERDNWSADQLTNTILRSGQSITLSNVTCYSSGVRVIAEDLDGCFVSKVVACTATAAWSITNAAVPDCGN